MTATDETLVLRPAETPQALTRAEGIELLGNVNGSGYEGGAALVRRADGQVVQLGPLLYALLETLDGRRSTAALAAGVRPGSWGRCCASDSDGRATRCTSSHSHRSSPVKDCSPATSTGHRRGAT